MVPPLQHRLCPSIPLQPRWIPAHGGSQQPVAKGVFPTVASGWQPWTPLCFCWQIFMLCYCQCYFPWIERNLVALTSLLTKYTDVLATSFVPNSSSLHASVGGFDPSIFMSLFCHCQHVTPCTPAFESRSPVTRGNPVFSSMLVFIAWWSDSPLWFSLMLVNNCQIHSDKELKWWGQGNSHLPFLFMTSLGWSLGWELSVYFSINPLSYFLNSSVTKSLTEKLQTGDPTAIWMN